MAFHFYNIKTNKVKASIMSRYIWIAILAWLATGLIAQNTDESAIDYFITQGMDSSEVMAIASDICDRHGSRLTGSEALDKAQDWAVDYLTNMGMANVQKEAWGEFGQGWRLDHFEMHAHTPKYWPVLAYPKAWSPSTGEITGEVVYLQASEIEDLERYKGQLKGKFVLLDTIRDVDEWFEPLASRHTAESLLDLANAPLPTPRPRRNWQSMSGFSFNKAMWLFLLEEEPAAVLDRGYKGDLGTVFVAGARVSSEERMRAHENEAPIVPQATLAIEHYNRIMRMLQKGMTVTLTMNLSTTYESPHDGIEHNVIAEIPGSDMEDEVVMFGAHFDSWHGSTGATDNGAGSAVMIEVARILLAYISETGQQPRRTLRLALWSGEEQGLYGSRNYVGNHLAEIEPGGWIANAYKPEHSKISAYYNLDNGTGKVRGIYTQGNADVIPYFRAWLHPFKDMDANTVSLSNTGGTDHLAFDGVGIPGFQFIQEPMAYFKRTHHSNMDNYDHLVEDDLKQAATIIASLVWHTAQQEEMMPRKPHSIEGKND